MGRTIFPKILAAALVLAVPGQHGVWQANAAADEEEEARQLRPYDDRALDVVTRPELTLFSSEREFAAYQRRFDAIHKKRRSNWGQRDAKVPIENGLAMQSGQEVCDDPEKCPKESDNQIIVTAQAASAPPSITNNQTVGVDEGDIVKQIGNYFLTLQDGRIFAVNIATMTLTDRIDAYRRDADGDPIGADWYDEMLVQGDNVLITAYSYDDQATELSVFRLDQATGKLSRRGVFLISSDDYYDTDNYATRVVGDKLVLYSPYDLGDMMRQKNRPVIRRWMGPDERDGAKAKGTPLIDAKRIYWPVMRTSQPSIHTVTICPLGKIDRRELDCDTTGFVAPERRQMFVSPKAVYLWTATVFEGDYWGRDECAEEGQPVPRAEAADVAPGVVYRVPINGDDPAVLPIRGGVFDQFSMDENDGRFRALTSWFSDRCEHDYESKAEVALLDTPINRFGNAYRESSGREFRPLPSPGKRNVENRFADDWLVYGGRDGRGSYPPDPKDGEGPKSAQAVAVPLKQPEKLQILKPGHEFIRVERVGNNIMMSGYSDDSGLMISLIGLREEASVIGQTKLEGRYESESRSHAFNATIDQSGGGLMGIPTVTRTRDAGRWWDYSDVSDVNFIGFGRSGKLADLGAILGRAKDSIKPAEGYDCEVSCIDWYGNSRPIFSMGRVFALMATDLVELTVRDGKVVELKRIDLTGAIARN